MTVESAYAVIRTASAERPWEIVEALQRWVRRVHLDPEELMRRRSVAEPGIAQRIVAVEMSAVPLVSHDQPLTGFAARGVATDLRRRFPDLEFEGLLVPNADDGHDILLAPTPTFPERLSFVRIMPRCWAGDAVHFGPLVRVGPVTPAAEIDEEDLSAFADLVWAHQDGWASPLAPRLLGRGHVWRDPTDSGGGAIVG